MGEALDLVPEQPTGRRANVALPQDQPASLLLQFRSPEASAPRSTGKHGSRVPKAASAQLLRRSCSLSLQTLPTAPPHHGFLLDGKGSGMLRTPSQPLPASLPGCQILLPKLRPNCLSGALSRAIQSPPLFEWRSPVPSNFQPGQKQRLSSLTPRPRPSCRLLSRSLRLGRLHRPHGFACLALEVWGRGGISVPKACSCQAWPPPSWPSKSAFGCCSLTDLPESPPRPPPCLPPSLPPSSLLPIISLFGT